MWPGNMDLMEEWRKFKVSPREIYEKHTLGCVYCVNFIFIFYTFCCLEDLKPNPKNGSVSNSNWIIIKLICCYNNISFFLMANLFQSSIIDLYSVFSHNMSTIIMCTLRPWISGMKSFFLAQNFVLYSTQHYVPFIPCTCWWL